MLRTLRLECRADVADSVVQAGHLRLDDQPVAEAVLAVLVWLLIARETVSFDLSDAFIDPRKRNKIDD
jgi:hypothetical protein